MIEDVVDVGRVLSISGGMDRVVTGDIMDHVEGVDSELQVPGTKNRQMNSSRMIERTVAIGHEANPKAKSREGINKIIRNVIPHVEIKIDAVVDY